MCDVIVLYVRYLVAYLFFFLCTLLYLSNVGLQWMMSDASCFLLSYSESCPDGDLE
ncbi:hypothetical protein BDV27DRAFT_137676 [Aspergillus caelatus]|uniref:Uncharacterized protein n=1 Tax=Aspergillus caelatus TaxID=61420 RepID=A0A5N6ZMM1_9EURO|nr:uncharacterized protein BDV27DRAFT_137676 [Aspergillus caelatus]KAE8358473.1 hypothetical protein BDV27DRAFT_137676 [Aspergillus caelatus]